MAGGDSLAGGASGVRRAPLVSVRERASSFGAALLGRAVLATYDKIFTQIDWAHNSVTGLTVH